VKLPVKSDYAARAVLGLARTFIIRVKHCVRRISQPNNRSRQTTWSKFLSNSKPRRSFEAFRGKEGGYLLARSPSEISLGDVLCAVHGKVFDTPALSDPDCPAELRRAWQSLQQAMQTAAGAITFQRLLEETVEKEKMYYI
jgi:DNA-binding IscR family transcriptional regulator